MVVNPGAVHSIPARWKVKCNPSGIKDNFTSSSSLSAVVDGAPAMTSLPRFASASYLVKKGGSNLFGTLPVRLCGNFVSGWKQVAGYQRSFDVCYAYRASARARKRDERDVRAGGKDKERFKEEKSPFSKGVDPCNCCQAQLSRGIVRNYRHLFFHINCTYRPVHRPPTTVVSVRSNTELLPLSRW